MHLPIALNLEGKSCLVVGGGAVAARKVTSLLECGAIVRVVSPQLSIAFDMLHERIKYFERSFEDGDCEGCMLAFACTNEEEVNARVVEVAHQFGAWCNRADDAGGSDFHGAATVRRGDICVGISTSGGSPALSRHLRRRIEEVIGDEYAALLELMSMRRDELEKRVAGQANRAALWRLILSSDALLLLKSGRRDEAEALVERLIEEASKSTWVADERNITD